MTGICRVRPQLEYSVGRLCLGNTGELTDAAGQYAQSENCYAENGENGFIVPERNAAALATAMAEAMIRNYESMSERSVQVALEMFDSTKNVTRIKDIMLQSVKVSS